ncbi:MAG: sugar phosphate isomerase/epimerase [Clostridiales bacterium]|nr:sugar phosphate isomerase/epimerase [Clostridiales bacterium]
MINNCSISGFSDEINQSIKVQTEVLEELGQQYLELRSADGINVADLTAEQAEELWRFLDGRGIQVSAIGSPIGKISITEDFEEHFKKFCHVVSLAKIFHTPYIRMFSFFIPEGEEPEIYREEVLKRTARMADYAKKHQVILLHENEKEIYGDTAERCLDLMKNFYGENFQCTFDFANFVQCGQDTMEAYQMLKPYIAYIHVKDALAENGEVVLPGDGDGNVKEILRMLEQEGFEGFLSLEPHLVNFAGLENLERDAKERREKDGIEAYKKAYGRLLEIGKK